MTALSPLTRAPKIAMTIEREPSLRRTGRSAAAVNSRQDRAEVSEHAQRMNRVAELPPARAEMVHRVRTQIASGDYLRDGAKIDIAIDRLLAQLGCGAVASEADNSRAAG